MIYVVVIIHCGESYQLMKLPLNLYTASQVRELDHIAIDNFAILGITLMQRAGLATFKIM